MSVLSNFTCGSFTSDGNAKTLNLGFTPDYMEVTNYTRSATAQNGTGVFFLWQNGMTPGVALQENTDAAGVLTISDVATGFTPIYQTQPVPMSALLTGTAVSGANPPVCSSGATGGLVAGNIVRLFDCTGAVQLNGYDFTVDTVVANTSFRLPYMAQIVAGTNFSYRYMTYEPMYYPRNRSITKVTQAANAVVTMSVTHGLTAGQKVTFVVPAVFGMVELNGLRGTIQSVDTTNNTITVDIDTSGFTAFAFPTTAVAAAPFTPAQVIPFGDGLDPTSLATSATLAGATRNTSIQGMVLAGGANGPAGQSNDVIYWRAFRASQVQTA